MISRWYEFKEQAISLRREGRSIRDIEKQLHIPRSTLSGWFKTVILTKEQKRELHNSLRLAGARGRAMAVVWHNAQKQMRLLEAKNQADNVLMNLNIDNKYIIELALAMLYLGEGSKKNQTAMGNSNPKIVKFFIKSVELLYNIRPSGLKCYLHLRSDQNPNVAKSYWSNILGIPIKNFGFTKDKRTIKFKTYKDYYGVCVVHVGKVAILRRLNFISEGFCAKILEH